MQQSTTPKNKKLIIVGLGCSVIIIAVLAVIFIPKNKGQRSFSFPSLDGSQPAPSQIQTKTTTDLEVTTYTLQPKQADMPAQVNGTLTNKGRQEYNMPIVSFSATEASGGASPDTCLALKPDPIAPGESWEFSAKCGQNMDPVSVQLIEVNYTQVK